MTVPVADRPTTEQECGYLRGYLDRTLFDDPAWTGARPPLHVAPLGLRNELTAPPPAEAGLRPLAIYRYGRTAIIGPVGAVHGQDSPCATCLAMRWHKLRSMEERNALERGGGQLTPNRPPHTFDAACELVAQVVAGILTMPAERCRTEPHGFPYVYEVELDSGQVHRFPLIADPECPVCSVRPADSPQTSAIPLQSRPKRDADSYRARSIHDYQLPIEAMANPVCGALGRGALPDLRCTTTAPVTGYMFMRGSELLHEFFWSGHGDSYRDSSLLAIFEGLERYAGLHRRGVTDPLVDSYRNIADRALDPSECGLYSEEFYDTQRRHFVRYSPDLKMPWVWGYSLRDEKPILVPERLVYYLGQDDASNFVQECSNGCASGSSFEEAVFHGLMELIERDAFLLGWYGRAPLPEIDTASITRRDLRVMIDRVAMEGYDVRLFDNRIDLRVPVVTGAAVRRDGGLGSVSIAAGASMDPEQAIAGALCEIASYVTTFEERVTGQLDEAQAMAADYHAVTDLHHHPLIYGLPSMLRHTDFLLGQDRPARAVGDLYAGWNRTRPRSLDLLDDLRHCVSILTDRGFDVIVADQTSPEQRSIGVHTAAVIVPGLIPIDFGWSKQRVLHMPRMRTAFRDAGWRDTELDPSELHLVPHPFP